MADKELIGKGMKSMMLAFPMFFIGPAVIYNAFMNQHTNWHYLVLGIGITICGLAIFFSCKGLLRISRGLFAK